MTEKKTTTEQVEPENHPVEAERRARVKAVKEAVRAGTYRVDEGAVADSLLSDLLWQHWETRRRRRP